jgi:hypothetical protein
LRDFSKELEEILSSDPLGLLNVKPKIEAISADQRLIESFQEINKFYELHKRVPAESNDITERKLFSRLSHLKKDFDKALSLKEFDIHGLLADIKEIETIDDVMDVDPLGLLSSEENDEVDIFTHRFTKTMSEREKADFVAKRKKCKEFDKYESLFKQVHLDLKNNIRKLLPYSENQLEPGTYFVIDGTLLFLESTLNLIKDKFGKFDGRTRVIFENGTESNMKYRSLGKRILDSGKTVSARVSSSKNTISETDTASGYIYILKSLSNNPEISGKQNLFKIGFTSNTVKERIKNSHKDPTYLMDRVESVAEFKTYNLNPQKLEDLIHTFFRNVKLDIKIKSEEGRIYSPNEWYIVPLDIIKAVIELIISGEIINYRYDDLNQRLVMID